MKRPYRIRVKCISVPFGTYVKVFNSYMEAARFLKGQPSHISEVVSGKRRTHKGYTFERVED